MRAQTAPTQPCSAKQPQTLTKTQASLHGRNLELNTHHALKTQQTHDRKLWWEISHYFQTVHFAKSKAPRNEGSVLRVFWIKTIPKLPYRKQTINGLCILLIH
jgi:hypothetical protein